MHLILWAILSYSRAQAQFAFQVEISSPSSGDAIQGTVPIIGSSSVNGFISYQVEFSLGKDINESWFNIITSGQPIENNVLAEWDTSALTDGEYSLRLTILRQDDDAIIFIVNDIRIRNYTPIETSTIGPTQTLVPGQVPTSTSTDVPATPTNLPENSLVLPQKGIQKAIIFGVSLAGLTFILSGIYALNKLRSHKNR
ncbi:MAG: Ig-like domain-containing protein [Chloroflexota bacterium]